MNEELPILIAEDDENDALILQRALRKVGFNNPFHISPTGTDAIRYLQGEGPYADRERYRFPRILFTDLKMPEMDGFELLHWLRSNPQCSIIPTLVLSASQLDSDITRAYKLGANSYLVKPSDFDQLVSILRLVFDYWQMCQKPKVPSKC
jgi:CheY-like chemotaxis protein